MGPEESSFLASVSLARDEDLRRYSWFLVQRAAECLLACWDLYCVQSEGQSQWGFRQLSAWEDQGQSSCVRLPSKSQILLALSFSSILATNGEGVGMPGSSLGKKNSCQDPSKRERAEPGPGMALSLFCGSPGLWGHWQLLLWGYRWFQILALTLILFSPAFAYLFLSLQILSEFELIEHSQPSLLNMIHWYQSRERAAQTYLWKDENKDIIIKKKKRKDKKILQGSPNPKVQHFLLFYFSYTFRCFLKSRV